MENQDEADSIFLHIAREDGKEPETIEDPDRRQLSFKGNDKVKPYRKSTAVQKLLNKILPKALRRDKFSAYQVVALLRMGKGAGNASGQQQWHTDLNEDTAKEMDAAHPAGHAALLDAGTGTAAVAARSRRQ